MKKFLSIFLINVILLVAILVSIEYYTGFKKFSRQGLLNGTLKQKLKETNRLFWVRYDCSTNQRYLEQQRPFKYEEHFAKDNIILLGCSYTYGDGLKEKETFSVKLSDYTNRNVLNLGMRCGSPKESLHILKNKRIKRNILKTVYNDAEYIIFTYIPDHKRRIYYDVCDFYYFPNFKYNKKQDKLVYYEKNAILKSSLFINELRDLYYQKYVKKQNKDFYLAQAYFKEINREIKKNFFTKDKKQTKFVILVYEEDGNEDWISLEKEGIQIIKVKDITGIDVFAKEYRLPDYHPNSKVWDVIIPRLSETLNL